MKRDMIELDGRRYLVFWSTDVLIPENRKYVDDVEAIAYTPKGTKRVTSAKTLSRIHAMLEEGL